MNSLNLKIHSQLFEIDLFAEQSPRTVWTLCSFLPFKIEMHYAKIAGEEVMAVMPFHVPLERAIEVAEMKAGILAFWPERHLLCLYYGALQEEAAQVNVVGNLKSGLERFRVLAELIRNDQGKKLNFCEIYLNESEKPIPTLGIRHAVLHSYEEDIWLQIPEELSALCHREGIMRPGGPILYAEADSRLFHEFLSVLRKRIAQASYDPRYTIVLLRESLQYFCHKMLGWYQLERTAAVVQRYSDRLNLTMPTSELVPLLDALSLFVGRLNMWLDSLIPWNEINVAVKKNRCQIAPKPVDH